MKDLSPLIDWLTARNTGTSSMNMARVHAGLPMRPTNQPPGDINDFRRCADLLERVPEVRESLPAIAACSPVWARFVERWEELDGLLKAGEGDKMQKIINGFWED
jgi:hypothetical protein